MHKYIFTKKNYNKLKPILKNKVVGLCHGSFDILHLGHIKHFKEAKKKCEILIVSITSHSFIKKSSNQPLFNDSQRTEVLLGLKDVDHVYVSHSITGEDAIHLFKPTFYIKGIDYINKKNDYNLQKEKNACKKKRTKLIFTKSEKFSSTKILNSFINKYSNKNNEIVKKIKEKYSVGDIHKIFKKAKLKNIALTGEPIIDEFRFVDVIGTATKNSIIASNYKFKQLHPGGSLAGAIMASEFVKKVIYLIPVSNKTLLPKLNNNIKKIFFNTNFRIPRKIRYLTSIKKNKIFQTNIISDFKINSKEYLNYLNKINFFKKKTALIMLDFGIGLINEYAVKKIEGLKFFLNVQTNSNNYGFNYFSKYKKFSYLSINLKEFELNFGKRIRHYTEIKNYINDMPQASFSVTLGKEGSIFINKEKKLFYCPSFFAETVDTTGCGDAYLIITSILVQLGYNDEIVPFIGNCYAGLHSQNFGNSKFPSKDDLLNTINSILDI